MDPSKQLKIGIFLTTLIVLFLILLRFWITHIPISENIAYYNGYPLELHGLLLNSSEDHFYMHDTSFKKPLKVYYNESFNFNITSAIHGVSVYGTLKGEDFYAQKVRFHYNRILKYIISGIAILIFFFIFFVEKRSIKNRFKSKNDRTNNNKTNKKN